MIVQQTILIIGVIIIRIYYNYFKYTKLILIISRTHKKSDSLKDITLAINSLREIKIINR